MDIIDKLLTLKDIPRDLFNQINDNYVITKYNSSAEILPKSKMVDVDRYVIYYLNLMCKDREFLRNYRISENVPVLCGLSIALWWSDKSNQKEINVIMACDYYNKKILEDYTDFKNELFKLPNYVIEKAYMNKVVVIAYPTMKIICNMLWTRLCEGFTGVYGTGYSDYYQTSRPFTNIIIKYVTEEHNKRNYDELNKYLIDNDLSEIFNMVVENLRVEIDMCSYVMTFFKITLYKCNIDGHNLIDILNICKKDDIKQININGFSYYDTNAIIASQLIKSKLQEVKKALLLGGPQLCEILLNNSHVDRQIKQTFMSVSKYFNNLVKNTNVLFECNAIVGCNKGCGNKIMIMEGSYINYLPECIECTGTFERIYMKGEYLKPDSWARCGLCKCLFLVPNIGTPYRGKNIKCEICR